MPPSLSIADRLDHAPIGRLHGFALAVCAIGFGFDLLEMALGSALAAVFSAAPTALPRAELSWLLASVYIGAIVGAPLFGYLADRFGRQRLMAALLALLAVSSAMAGVSKDTAQLTLWRGISGLALGAYPALMMAYLSDLLPIRQRGRLIFLVVGLASIGAPAGLMLVRWLTPIAPLGLEAWRWAFLIGSGGAAVSALLMLRLPESPRWLTTRGRPDDAEAACLRFVPQPVILPEARSTKTPSCAVPIRRSWPAVAMLFFASPWSTVAFPLLAGALLVGRGFQLSDTLLYVAVSNVGPMLAVLLAALGIDRLERRFSMALCAGTMLLACMAFAWADSPLALTLSATAFTLAAALYVPSLSLYGAELFPTHARASAFGGAWTFNRIGAAMAPLLLLPLLQAAGATALLAVVACSLLLSLVLLKLAPRGAARQSLN
jgi:putative MFS transporter